MPENAGILLTHEEYAGKYTLTVLASFLHFACITSARNVTVHLVAQTLCERFIIFRREINWRVQIELP